MSKITSAPLYDPVVDKSLIATPSWTIFFNRLFTGDTGTDWTPTFQNLGSVGTPTITGKYYALSRSVVYFRVVITPATNTSSTAGTTYIDNFPLNMIGDGTCSSAVPSIGLGGAIGVCVSSSGRIYTPSWTTVSAPVIIVGMMEAQ